MELTKILFPGIKDMANKADIPVFPNGKNPWSILNKNEEGNLENQLDDLISSLDNSIEKLENVMIDTSAGGVYIHPSAKISEFVKIEGPSYIGQDVEIRHSAYLRKCSWICKGSLVGHSSEIKNSILLPKSKAPHFNYVGDSILGCGVNLGAGTKLSNVRNDKRDIRISMDDGKYQQTMMKKLGSLVGDYSEVGCNVVMNPGTILYPNSKINPNVTLSGYWKNN